MNLRNTVNLLVCLLIMLIAATAQASAWNFEDADYFAAAQQGASSAGPPNQEITKVTPKKIYKVKPPAYQPIVSGLESMMTAGLMPTDRPRTWEIDAEALFVRARGKVRFNQNYAWGYAGDSNRDIDFNGDMGLPEHLWTGSFSARYRFKPQWSLRYSVMPVTNEYTGVPNSSYNFGNIINTYGQTSKVKWEMLYQRIGIAYDPVRTFSSRLTVFGDYVLLNDKLSVSQANIFGSTMYMDLGMAMAGIELERSLKTTRLFNTLSLECRAGFAFGDNAFGSDLSTGIKYSLPLGNGRFGFVSGGYRYLTYKKKFSDVKLMDTAMDGGYLKMGFIF